MTFLISVGAFLLAISILISFHEFGHYWVARKCGVRVLRFSVGFGRPLFCHVSERTGTEWVLARWPLGGYVKMLDKRDPDTGELTPEEQAQEFTGKPLTQRAMIIAAGPIFNFILAVFLYALVSWVGETGLRPLVGHVQQDSPAAQAGLAFGDEILEINSQPVRSWSDMLVPLLDSGMKGDAMVLEVHTQQGLYRQLQLEPGAGLLKNENVLSALGMSPMRATSAPIIGEVSSGSAAQAAGLQSGDRILSLATQPIASWQGLTEAVRSRGGQQVLLEWERDGQVLSREARIDAVIDSGAVSGRLGVLPYVDEVLLRELQVTVNYPLGESLMRGLERTGEYTVLTLKVLGRLVIGEVSPKSISGPVGIASFAGSSAMNGLTAFLSMMALLSLSLGILNLLPIPVLDGGHLVWCAVEAVTRRPVAERVEAAAQRVGIAVLSALMLLALYNDFIRLAG